MLDDKSRLIAAIEELRPTLVLRADDIDRGRHMPADIVATLRDIGVYRMFAPRSHHGTEMSLPDAVAVLAALASINASIAWNVFVGTGGALLAPLLSREVYDRFYGGGPDVIAAGSTQPVGVAKRVKDGWRVSGRWPIVSGAHEADWLGGLCVMTEDGKPLPGAGDAGVPWMKLAILPASCWQIEDTWDALGLRGTGSVHVSLDDELVPDDQFLDLMTGRPCVFGPLYDSPAGMIPLLQAAVAVGNCEGALSELIQQTRSGWRQRNAASAAKDSEYFQGEIGRVSADIRAARAMLNDTAQAHWLQVLAGHARDKALQAQATQAGVWIVQTCVRSVDACYSLGGSNVIMDSSPLQRRLRDMHTSSQHFNVQARHYVDVGKLLLQAA